MEHAQELCCALSLHPLVKLVVSLSVSEAHRIHILRRRESAASLPEEIVVYNFTFSTFLSFA